MMGSPAALKMRIKYSPCSSLQTPSKLSRSTLSRVSPLDSATMGDDWGNESKAYDVENQDLDFDEKYDAEDQNRIREDEDPADVYDEATVVSQASALLAILARTCVLLATLNGPNTVLPILVGHRSTPFCNLLRSHIVFILSIFIVSFASHR